MKLDIGDNLMLVFWVLLVTAGLWEAASDAENIVRVYWGMP